MAKYKQGYSDRMDESLGMRNGKKSQSYKSRRDESYGMKSKMYGNGVMGHATETYTVNSFAAQRRDLGRMDVRPMEYRGTPDQAFEYKY